jgi:hypothetical protein
MDILWHVIHFVTTSTFLMLFTIFSILPIVIALSIWKGRLRHIKYYAVVVALALVSVFFGTEIAVGVVHAFGEKGTATITGSYPTSTVYNNHDVAGYHVLLKTADGRVVETSFEDDDFNIYPSKNAVIYPGVGDHFTVYYLRRFPDDFIIVDNDDSPWAAALRCGKLRDAVQEANAKYEFDRSNTSYRTAYIAVINQLLADKCVIGESELNAFRHDIENVRAGQP